MQHLIHKSSGVLLFTFTAWAACGQGSPTPAGAPAPAMKSLDQIEARTPIGSLPFTIASSGSYYLTTNLGGAALTGIIVFADNVTLDLNGFVLGPGTGRGVYVPGLQKNIGIGNGTIRAWSSDGLKAATANVTLHSLRVEDNSGNGAWTGPQSTVRDCTFQGNSGVGLVTGTEALVARCVASENAGGGFNIAGGLVSQCHASSNSLGGSATGIVVGDQVILKECSAVRNGGSGIAAGNGCDLNGNLANDNGVSSVGDGILTTGSGNRIRGNQAKGNSGWGIHSAAGTNADVTVGNLVVNNSAGDYQPASGDSLGPIASLATASNLWANAVRAGSYCVTLTQAGNGSGTVTSSPAGINCGLTCATNFPAGSTVTLTAYPAAHCTFVGWSGPDAGGAVGTNCTLTLNGPKAVTANFALVTYPVIITKVQQMGSGQSIGNGSITSVPSGLECSTDATAVVSNCPYGTVLTLTAVPAPNSLFSGWSGSGTSGTGPCVLTVDGTKNVTATFTGVSYPLTISNCGGGSVASFLYGINCGGGGACTANIDRNTAVTLTATPAAGSAFLGWSGGGCTGTGSCTVIMTSATTVTPSFSYGLTTIVTGTGTGTISNNLGGYTCSFGSCSNVYACGTTLALTPIPGPQSYFTGWGNGCSGSGSCYVTMTGHKTVSANFDLQYFNLSVSLGGTGTGNVTSTCTGPPPTPGQINCPSTYCSASFLKTSVVTLSANPAVGSTFVGWNGTITNNPYAVTIDASKSISATFNRTN